MKTLFGLFLATASCIILRELNPGDDYMAAVQVIYVLAAFMIARFTQGFLYGTFAAVAGVLLTNFIFTYPYWAFNFTLPGYPVTILCALIVSVTTSTMTARIKEQGQLQLEAEREKMRSNLLRSISHDLRTPITVIKGYSEYLDRNIGKDVLTNDGTREIAGYIHEAASRLEDYANSVHEVQALEDMSLDYKEISLTELMKEMQTQLSVQSEQHQTKINISGQLPEQTVSLAPAAVFRILENIVSNALRYCKSKIDIDFSYSQPFLIITVTDDGKGFSAQDRAEAVNYFYKGKKEKEHFGIGLTICKILAEKHGGTISLDNATEGGARVSVELEIK